MGVHAIGGLTGTRFFSGTYDEALGLLRRSRDYLAGPGERDRARLSHNQGLIYSLESMRLTARLTRVMAWLFVQRAVCGGEMTIMDARDDGFRLDNVAVCLEETKSPHALPTGLARLLTESDRLYRRVSRLDQMLRRDSRD